MTVRQIMQEIAAERLRQVEVEGYSIAHDVRHLGDGGLAFAAGCYSIGPHEGEAPLGWPWTSDDWKPKDRRRDLVRSAALALAHRDACVYEIARLDGLHGGASR